ncbi:MAG: T9SS type A sorting domain-containing protein [Bacteroidetes bacterium]|nr:T9SS type A sorting domain-containing protein [Bacteroidota bacterium]
MESLFVTRLTAMRATLILCLAFPWRVAIAQNWVLINPVYHYNFNDDGSDTIKFQLRTTQLDTVGVDSLLYELPEVAQPCTDCGDTCNLRFNVPQFFQRTCLATPLKWQFQDPEEFVIIPKAQVGEPWLFNPLDSIWGAVVNLAEEEVLGALDSVRTMVTPLQDTIRWSKNHGVLLWHLHDAVRYTLIGIRGLNVGRMVPPLNAFYPFQPGDLVYAYQYLSSNMQSSGWTYRYEVLDRADTPGHIEFTVNKYWRFASGQGQVIFGHDTAAQWVADSISIPALSSWPGQLVVVGQSIYNEPEYIVASHRLGPDGSYIITGADLGGQSLMFDLDSVPGFCAFAFMPEGNQYELKTGLGSSWSYNYMIDGSGSWGIMGAIIGGDTIGMVYGDTYFHVGVAEHERISMRVAPNPGTGRFMLEFPDPLPAGSFCSAYDAVGKLLFQRPLAKGQVSGEIDLSHFGKGTYLVRVTSRDGVCNERVVVQ